jgi:hypothetical protein
MAKYDFGNALHVRWTVGMPGASGVFGSWDFDHGNAADRLEQLDLAVQRRPARWAVQDGFFVIARHISLTMLGAFFLSRCLEHFWLDALKQYLRIIPPK